MYFQLHIFSRSPVELLCSIQTFVMVLSTKIKRRRLGPTVDNIHLYIAKMADHLYDGTPNKGNNVRHAAIGRTRAPISDVALERRRRTAGARARARARQAVLAHVHRQQPVDDVVDDAARPLVAHGEVAAEESVDAREDDGAGDDGERAAGGVREGDDAGRRGGQHGPAHEPRREARHVLEQGPRPAGARQRLGVGVGRLDAHPGRRAAR